MNDFGEFRNRICVHCGIIAAVIWLISLPILGLEAGFFIGDVVGTLVTILNFLLLAKFGKQLVSEGSKKPMVGGYFLRMLIYGFSFVLCLYIGKRIGGHCGLGCALGFFSLQLSLFVIYGVESRLPGAKVNPLNDWTEPKQWRDPSEWDDEEDDWKDL